MTEQVDHIAVNRKQTNMFPHLFVGSGDESIVYSWCNIVSCKFILAIFKHVPN